MNRESPLYWIAGEQSRPDWATRGVASGNPIPARAYNTRLLAPGALPLRRPVAKPACGLGCQARTSSALRAGSAAAKRYTHADSR